MAGLGTCLWQGFPEFNNMRIVRALHQSGSITMNPNDRIGYGIPDMKKAFSDLLVEYATSTSTISSCTTIVSWNSKDMAAMKYEIERKAPGEINFSKVGEINPLAGTILANRRYQFVNILFNVSAGTVSYRIRQIIDTAASTFTALYIDTANVTVNAFCPEPFSITGTLISLAPNPSSGQVNLLVETNFDVTDMPVYVYDIKGRLMLRLKLSKGIGKATFDLPVNRFAKGKYTIVVYNKDSRMGTAEMIRL